MQQNEVESTGHNRQIFVNLAVKILRKQSSFYKIGFKFNPQFTNENATCMIIGKDSYVMLLVEKFFKGFIPNKQICDAKRILKFLLHYPLQAKKKLIK